MLENNIIEPAKSPWSSPLLIVPKKADANGEKKWRVVIDYRELNERIIADKFPLPNITEILDSLAGSILFSHLDLSSGFYQVELEEESRPYTDFVTDRGQWQMKRLPMGLKISPSSFSRLMTVAMSGLSPEACFVYLDDIIVHGRNLDEHNSNLVRVLEKLRKVNLKLNPAKCEFLKRTLLYLGHKISDKRILPDDGKITAIANWPVPTNADEVVRFVATANYYRRFIKGFAGMAVPLNRLLKKGVTFNWDTECQTAFEQFKVALSNPPLLQFPDFSDGATFILRTDASKVTLGATLSNANDMPIAFSSRPLNKSERNYPIIELELLAIVWAVQHFRPYLFGKRFEILTDHRPLVYLFSMTDPSSRLTKFRLKLETFDFVIKYVKGAENVTANALSRIILTSEDLKAMNSDASVMVITRSKTKSMEKDNACEVVEVFRKPVDAVEIRVLEQSEVGSPEMDTSTNSIKLSKGVGEKNARVDILNSFVVLIMSKRVSEILFYITEDNEKTIKGIIKQIRFILPRDKIKILTIKGPKRIYKSTTKELILNQGHLSPASGHFGRTKMFETLKRIYYWPTLRQDINDFVDKCKRCKFHKHTRSIRQPLTITTSASRPFEIIELDLVGPLVRDKLDNKYILSIHCKLSRFIVATAIRDKSSDTVARAFVKSFILKYAAPKAIVTDRGKEFTASLFGDVCKLLNITKLQSTAYHHETMGLTESSHKHLGNFLRMYSKDGEDWSDWIDYWSFAYNTAVHTSTKYTPYELVHGNRCQEIESYNDSWKEWEENPNVLPWDDYLLEVKNRLAIAYKDVNRMDVIVKENRKKKWDKLCNPKIFEVGDRLLIRKEGSNKLQALYDGPFEVIAIHGPNLYIKKGNITDEIHSNRAILF